MKFTRSKLDGRTVAVYRGLYHGTKHECTLERRARYLLSFFVLLVTSGNVRGTDSVAVLTSTLSMPVPVGSF